MKKIYYFLLLSFLSLQVAFSQNLVVDPGFEITANGCSGFIPFEGMSGLVHWDNISNNNPGDTCSTPDLFSTCNTGMLGVFTGVPNNFIGNQCPKSGEKYAGIITYDMSGSYREYVQGELSSPLQAGQTYCVSFYVSLGDDVPFASNNIGVHFANTHQVWNPVCGGTWSPPNLTPQLNYTCVLTNTNWVRLQWDYVATGGEQYIIIGNFYNNGATTTQTTGQTSPNPFAYYYLDDVSVTAGSCCYTEIMAPNVTECEIWENENENSNNSIASFCVTDSPVDLLLLTPTEGSTCGASTSNVTGTWSGTGITNATTGTFSPAVAGGGTHTITFTASCGYVATANITVSPCALQVCIETNGTLTASGGVAPYTWSSFQPGGTITITNQAECVSCGYTWQSFIGCMNGMFPATSCTLSDTWVAYATGTNTAAPASYPIQVSDGGGGVITINNASSLSACSADPCAGVTITASIVPTHATCTTNGSAIATATGGTAPYSFSWNTTPPQTNANATNLAPGNYTVTVTDNNNCVGTQSVTINPAAGAPTVTIAPTHATCTTNGSAIATVTGGTTPYSFSWNTTPVQTNPNATNLAPGNYTVTVTDNNNCVGTQSVTINPAAGAPTVTIAPTHATCTTNGSAIATATGGTAPYSFSWNTTPPQTNPNATNLAPGNYTVTVTDNSNCVGTQSVTINPAAGAPTVTMSTTDTQCTINSGSATATPSGGTGPYSFSWNTTPPQTGQTATGLGVGSYTVTVTDNAGCQTVESVNVVATNAPSINIIASQDVSCFESTDGTATVNASGGTAPYSFSWNTTPPQTNANAINLAPGTYTATVTDNNGCSNVTQVTIGTPDELVVVGTITHTNCGAADGEIALSVTGGNGSYTFNWNPSVSTTDVATGLAIGTYSVIVTDQLGCSDSLTTTIVTNVSFNLDAYPNASIDAGQSIVLNIDVEPGIVVDQISWTPATGLNCTDCASPTATPSETTTYYVMVTDDQGCIALDTVIIVVLEPCGELFVPNIFSPNADGLNDLECVMGDCVASMDFTIFNRWGEVVFSSDNQSECWDGTFRGKPVQSGVYVYKLRATLNTGDVVNLSGNINVVR